MKILFETNRSKIRNIEAMDLALNILEKGSKQGFFRAKGESEFRKFSDKSLVEDGKLVELHIVKVEGKGELKFNGNLSYNDRTNEVKFYILSVHEFDTFNFDDIKMASFINEANNSMEEDFSEFKEIIDKLKATKPKFERRDGGRNYSNGQNSFKGGSSNNGGQRSGFGPRRDSNSRDGQQRTERPPQRDGQRPSYNSERPQYSNVRRDGSESNSNGGQRSGFGPRRDSNSRDEQQRTERPPQRNFNSRKPQKSSEGPMSFNSDGQRNDRGAEGGKRTFNKKTEFSHNNRSSRSSEKKSDDFNKDKGKTGSSDRWYSSDGGRNNKPIKKQGISISNDQKKKTSSDSKQNKNSDKKNFRTDQKRNVSNNKKSSF